jgi:hypothetical protein
MLPIAKARGFLGSLLGLPASSRHARFGFHRTRSYCRSIGMSSLCSRQFLFVFGKELGVADHLTSGKSHEGLQAQISTHL